MRRELSSLKYRFKLWFFRWVKDEDGDIGLRIAGCLTFIKYKEHTIVRFGREPLPTAHKYYTPVRM